MFQRGEKVIYLPEGKIYDFGYYLNADVEKRAVIYEEGECNMQDAISVYSDKLIRVSDNTSDSIKDTFRKIFEASAFDKKSLEQKALKLAEETGEVAQAILSYCGAPACGYKNKTKEDAIEELIDCIITAGALIYQIENGEVDEKHFCNVVDAKLRKWIKKSTTN